MKRLTRKYGNEMKYYNMAPGESTIDRLAEIEGILGDDYDLSRLRELVQADREGRCVVLPISVPSMAYTVNPKEKYISTGIYMTPGSVLHDTERGYIIAKTYEVAEATLKEVESKRKESKMAEYIDREALIEKFWDACKNCLSEDDIADLIDDVSAADVAPVVHGRWICGDYVFGETEWKCSNCGETEWRTSCSRMKYCMFCGAKMDEGEKPNE